MDEWLEEGKELEKEIRTSNLKFSDIIISLLPFIGIILGIVQIAKKRYRRGGIILTISISISAIYLFLIFIYNVIIMF